MRRELHGFCVVAFESFPFLYGGTFIEVWEIRLSRAGTTDCPSFWERLSLRRQLCHGEWVRVEFPFLFGGAFIEAPTR